MREYLIRQEQLPKTSSEESQEDYEWRIQRINEIGYDKLEKLARKAMNVKENAYKVYSKYGVGAAILTTEKSVFTGVNVENAPYLAGHAEFSAITHAVGAGIINRVGRRFIDAIAVVAGGDSGPCGFCRQMIYEFADNCLVLDVSPEGKIMKINSLKYLLPDAFGPSQLGIE